MVESGPPVARHQKASENEKKTAVRHNKQGHRNQSEHYYQYLLGQILLQERSWIDAEEALTKVAENDAASLDTRLLISHLATQRGDIKKAIRFAHEVVALDPTNMKALQLLSGLYTATKAYRKAAEQYEKILQASPDHTLSRLKLAPLYGRLHALEKARNVLAPLFKKPSLAWKAHLALGRAFVNLSDMQGAAVQFQAAHRLEQNRLETALALGAILQEINRPKEAEQVYRDYLAKHPNSQEVRTRLGRLFLNQDDQNAALTEFQAISQISPDSISARLTSALILLSQKRFEDALRELRLAEVSHPTDHTVQYYLGQVLEAMNRTQEAETAYGKVSPSALHHQEAQLRMAFLESERGERARGQHRVRALLDTMQQTAQTTHTSVDSKKREALIVALNILLMQDERYHGVVKTASQGLALDPDHGRLRFNRAVALDKLGRWPEAEKDLILYIQKHPNDANALNYLGYTWAERNENLEEAWKLLQRAIQLAPGDGFITDSLGWVLFRLNRLKESLEYMREAVRLEPKDATIQEHLGDVLNALGQTEKARAAWTKAQTLDPDNAPLRDKLRDKLRPADPSLPPRD